MRLLLQQKTQSYLDQSASFAKENPGSTDGYGNPPQSHAQLHKDTGGRSRNFDVLASLTAITNSVTQSSIRSIFRQLEKSQGTEYNCLMAEALCLGEILVDWVCTTVGAELDSAQVFTKAAGGAPANTAVGLARQGVSTAFIGRVSDDAFGIWLKSILENDGIDLRGTISDAQAQTRMAYVVTTATGDRKLAEFSKISCADARLQPQDLIEEQFEEASVLHFGSISLIENPAQEATAKAVELARKHAMLVSYDPNVRIGLWATPEICKNKILETLDWGDIVKINEDELFFLTGSRSLESADRLRVEHNIGLLIITLDSRGAYFTHNSGSKTVSGYKVKLLEATGAGDGFNSGVLHGLINLLKKETAKRKGLDALSIEQITAVIARANAVGALTCTKAGAIPALPTTAAIEEFLLLTSSR